MGRAARRTLIFAGAFLPLMAVAARCGAQRPRMPEHGFRVGEPFPTIALPSLENGELTSIDAFRGEKVVLHLFASW